MSNILGIIGGGQLGMMLAEAATMPTIRDQISSVIVLDPTLGKCPASKAGAEQIVADFGDKDAIVELSKRVDILTYEIESGDSDVLKSVEKNTKINPSPETLRTIQDKLLQKRFLHINDIAVPEFAPVDTTPDDLVAAINRFGYPVLLKARRDAYDGKGNLVVHRGMDLQKACSYFGDRTLMIEKFIPFRIEVSVIAARSTTGEIKTYPLVENIHENNILRQTIAPARTSLDILQKAKDVAENVMSVLQGAGVFGIEMFVTRDDQILINEIAPRVHNSGHHTLQSSDTSQFEQHLRAILGMELGSTTLRYNTIMYNILGSDSFNGEYAPPQLSTVNKNVFLKMYGKATSKPLRKLGHLNLVGLNGESVESLLTQLERIKPQTMASMKV